MTDRRADPRLVAAETLVQSFSESSYSNLTLAPAMDRAELTGQQRAFCAALFFGVLERAVTLDAVIDGYGSRPAAALTPAVRQLLRLGVYQMLYMPSVAEYAAVGECVELTRALGCGQAAGYVNGVLRAFLRGGRALPAQKTPQATLAVEYGVPEWIVRLWQKQYGEEAARTMLCGSTGKAPVYLRVNTAKTTTAALTALLTEEGLSPLPVPELPDALAVTLSGNLTTLASFGAGLWHVQDLSSQRCAAAVAPAGQRVLDVCAAPGGKSFTMKELGAARVVALDRYPGRVALIESGARRLGLAVEVALGDAAVYDPSLGLFDRVLCDVPCSGLGVMRRKPEIRYKSPAELDALPEIQYNILDTAARSLAPGGRMVYSTCTLNKKENERVVERFLVEHPDCRLAETATTLPRPTGGDGFFYAALEKTR